MIVFVSEDDRLRLNWDDNWFACMQTM